MLFHSIAQKRDGDWINRQATAILPEAVYDLADMLRIPNDGHYRDQVMANIAWCTEEFSKRGFNVDRLETEGMPLLLAKYSPYKRRKTVLFYMQIDGQPVDASEWDQEDPWEPVIKKRSGVDWEIVPWSDIIDEFDPDWRIFGRSASDSKGPATSFIKAFDILKLHNLEPEYNISVIMDFQEELGSPDLPAAVMKYRDLFNAEYLVIMDGTRHVSGLPTLTFGARGIATVRIVIYGPSSELHSGQYGNYAPNPVFKAARLIAGMKDSTGMVTIPGFYRGIEFDDQDMKIMNSVPEDREELLTRLGINEPEQPGSSYEESMQYPSLNVRGLKAAWTGKEVRTIIPSEVEIEIDMRLSPETDGEYLVERLRNYMINKGFHLTSKPPDQEERLRYDNLATFEYKLGSKPFRTPLNSPMRTWLETSYKTVFGNEYVLTRTTGGSQPIAPFIRTLDVPAVSLRIPNPDNNIHAPNENLRIGNLREGISATLSLLLTPLN